MPQRQWHDGVRPHVCPRLSAGVVGPLFGIFDLYDSDLGLWTTRWPAVENRPATLDDLDAIVELTRQQRRRLAAWCPVYFNPRDGADEAHARWLETLIRSGTHDTRVLADHDAVVGFYHLIAQSARTWVDDLCIADDSLWPQALSALTARPPWVTCVAVADGQRSSALAALHARPVATFYTSLLPSTHHALIEVPEITNFEPWPVEHIFSERPFRPEAPGALVIVGHDGGYAVGSASVDPPIYDPGGPSCVVDTIRGGDRYELLLMVMGEAAARGDAQMIVVCAAHDDPLREALVRAGFEPQVNLHARR